MTDALLAVPVAPPPPAVLWQLATAGVGARALQVVAELGVADHVEAAGSTAEALAAACGVEPRALDRLLRLLVTLGVFEHGAGGYTHNDASILLRSGAPGSMRSFARMMGLPFIRAGVGAMELSVRSGVAACEQLHAGGLWGHLGEHPEDARIFAEAMESKAGADTAAVLDAYDFGRFPTIADVGGGRGHFLRAALERSPQCTGTLFDLPGVIGSLAAPPPGITHHAGDFFQDPLPIADAYVLMDVLHDWADGDASKILRAVRRAAAPGATLLVIEATIAEGAAAVRSRTLDVLMLAVTGGRERTTAELAVILEDAGFILRQTIPTSTGIHVVEAVAV